MVTYLAPFTVKALPLPKIGFDGWTWVDHFLSKYSDESPEDYGCGIIQQTEALQWRVAGMIWTVSAIKPDGKIKVISDECGNSILVESGWSDGGIYEKNLLPTPEECFLLTKPGERAVWWPSKYCEVVESIGGVR